MCSRRRGTVLGAYVLPQHVRRPLRAVLTLMRPDGRTVQAYCEIPAGDEPGTCETPREPTVGGGVAPYTAVAEVADARGERKLLRAGSNAPTYGRGSDQ